MPLNEALTQGDTALKQLAPVPQARENPVYQLNTAFLADGAVIAVAPGAKPDRPVHLRFVGAGAAPFSTATRVLVQLGEAADFALLESHEGPDGLTCQPNDALDVVVGPRASELVHPISVAVAESLTVDQMAHAFTVYPSMSGSIAEAARRLHHSPQ